MLAMTTGWLKSHEYLQAESCDCISKSWTSVVKTFRKLLSKLLVRTLHFPAIRGSVSPGVNGPETQRLRRNEWD
jgi:hypothetical protein